MINQMSATTNTMPPTRSKNLRLVPVVYLAIIGIITLLADVLYDTLSIPYVIICLFMCLPLLIRNKLVHLSIGYISAAAFGYMLIILTVWLVQYITGKEMSQPLVRFGVGYLFAGISFVASIAVVYLAIKYPFNSKKL